MRTSLSLIALAVGSFAAVPCLASTIDLGFTGTATVGSNFIEFHTINQTNGQTGAPVPVPGYGDFLVTQPVQGVFASTGITTGDYGQIESFMGNAPGSGSGFTQPFIKFSTSSVVLNLDTLNPGNIPNSPFVLANTPSGATASFSVNGTLWNGTTSMPYVGVFSATFAGTDIATLEAEAASGVTTAFSATISTGAAVPEPASLALLGLGLLGLGIFTRKKVAGRS